MNHLYVKRLKQIRMAKGLSRMAVAAHLGISLSYFGWFESGYRNPPNPILDRWRGLLVDGPVERTWFYGKER